MLCKYCDDYSGICFNPESPMRADACPVPDVEGVCKFEDREVEIYVMTPSGCATCALMDAELAESIDDPRIEIFWERFTNLMERFGYAETREADAGQEEREKE